MNKYQKQAWVHGNCKFAMDMAPMGQDTPPPDASMPPPAPTPTTPTPAPKTMPPGYVPHPEGGWPSMPTPELDNMEGDFRNSIANIKVVSSNEDDEYTEPNEDPDGRRIGPPVTSVNHTYVLQGIVHMPQPLLQHFMQSMPNETPEGVVSSLIVQDFHEYGEVPYAVEQQADVRGLRDVNCDYDVDCKQVGPSAFQVTANVTLSGNKDYEADDSDRYYQDADNYDVSDGPY